jgi:hypothetical protein
MNTTLPSKPIWGSICLRFDGWPISVVDQEPSGLEIE